MCSIAVVTVIVTGGIGAALGAALAETVNIINQENFQEFAPALDGRVEFVLPADFDGKIGFVFYEAELRGLSITAYYE